MKSEDILELSSEAFLVVLGSKVVYANGAAHSLFLDCGRADSVVGAELNDLWEPAVYGGPAYGATLMRARGSQGPDVLLEVAESRPATPGSEYAIRVTKRMQTAQPQAGADLVRLRQLLDTSLDAIMLVDYDGRRYVDVNRAALDLLGYERDDLLARGPFQNRELDPAWREYLESTYAGLIERSPQAVTTEEVFLHCHGARIPVSVTRHALRVDGRWLIFVTARDISLRKTAEERLELFRAAMDNSMDSLIIIDRESMRYVAANQIAVERSGLTHEQYLASDPHAHSWAGATRSDLEAEYDRLVTVSPQPRVTVETRSNPDGSTFPAEIVRVAMKIRDRWVIVLSVRDITDRQVAAQRLARISAALNEAADAIQVVDPETMTYEDVNEAAARLYGISRDEMLRLGPAGVERIGGLGRAGAALARFGEAISRYPDVVAGTDQLSSAGAPAIAVEYTLRAVRVDGKWLIVNVTRDITERVAAQQRLQLLSVAIDEAPDSIVVLDPDALAYVAVNDAAARVHGATRDEMLKRGVVGFMLAIGMRQDEGELRQLFREVIAKYPESAVEVRQTRTLDGRNRIMEATRRAVRLDDKWLVISVNRDITERRSAERRLERLVAALNESAESIFLTDPDSMEYVDANEAAARTFGMTREEMIRFGPIETNRRLGLPSADALRDHYRELIAMHPRAETGVRKFEIPGHPAVMLEYSRRAVKVDGDWLILTIGRDATERLTAQRRLERLQAAVNEAVDSIIVIDPEAISYVDINQATARLYGMSREEMMERGLPWVIEHLQLGTIPMTRAFYQGIIEAHPEARTEVREFDRGGEKLVIESIRRAVQLDGKWLIVSVARDITARRTAERRLERLATAINDSVDSVVIIDPVTMEYLDVNEAAARIFDVSREEMIRLGPVGTRAMGCGTKEELHAHCQHLIDIHPRAETGIRPYSVSGKAERMVEFARRAVTVDGQWLIVTVGRDVTERLATQRRLEQLRAAVNQASDMVLVIDPEAMTFVEINEAAAREYGLSREDMMEHGVEWVTHHVNSWTFERLTAHYAELIAKFPEPATVLSTTAIEGMPEKFIETTRRALQMEGQWLIISVGRNVTERVRAERELHQRMEELARSNRDLEQFAYVTSHDLSEPLRMVGSYTQLLARRYGTHFDDDGREFMGYIVAGAQRMKQLIDDLLAYSRAGRAGFTLRDIPLDKPLDDAIENLAHAISEAGAVIERPAALPTLPCDKTGMTLVFQNLIANAIKFRGEAPVVVRIDAAQDAGDWVVSVADNGIGIAPEYFERIFVIFQRLHGRAAYEGTGIGLSICKRIVERHGGTIWVESVPGLGATFKFRLTAQPVLTT